MSGHVSDCCHAVAVVSLHRWWHLGDTYRCTRCLRICGTTPGRTVDIIPLEPKTRNLYR